MMHEVEQEEIDRAKKEKRVAPPLRMVFDINHGTHDRRLYNLPTANEVAAVFQGEHSEVPTYRHIAIHPRGQDLQTISILHPHCNPMIYPLLFPRGDKEWYPDLQKIDQSRNRKRVSMLQFYYYRLAIRQGSVPSNMDENYCSNILSMLMSKPNKIDLHSINKIRRLFE